MKKNLIAEIAKSGKTKTEIVKDERITYNLNTLIAKIKGDSEFTYSQAVMLKEVIGSEMPLELLFLDEDE